MPAGLCCKKPLARQLKQRFVVLLLRSGKKRSQVERCPEELAWLLSLVLIMTFTRALPPGSDPGLPVTCMAQC